MIPFSYKQLAAALDEIEQGIKRMQMQPPFVVEVDSCTCYGGSLPGIGHEPGCGQEQGPGWWLIEHMQRAVAEDRMLLKLHRQVWPYATTDEPSNSVAFCSHGYANSVLHKVRDMLPLWEACTVLNSMARRLQIKPQEAS